MSDITLPITDATKAWVALAVTVFGTAVTSTLGILAVTNPTSIAFWVLTVIAAVLTPIGAAVGVYNASNKVVGTTVAEPSKLAVVPKAAAPVVEAPVVAAPTVDPTATFSPVASADV